MSRELPPYPNLEYLKKQAKDLLRDMEQRDPAYKLADAQYAIAREYGFSSWPKLKAHVESLSRPATPIAPTDSGPAAAPGKTNPFVGGWLANMSKSARHPDSPFHRATLHFDVVGDDVTITDVIEDPDGNVLRIGSDRSADLPEGTSWRDKRGELWEKSPAGEWSLVKHG
jgi:Glyoxalase superfamily protein